jgi:hypothetical protein
MDMDTKAKMAAEFDEKVEERRDELKAEITKKFPKLGVKDLSNEVSMRLKDEIPEIRRKVEHGYKGRDIK